MQYKSAYKHSLAMKDVKYIEKIRNKNGYVYAGLYAKRE
jgi:hypothetical protein